MTASILSFGLLGLLSTACVEGGLFNGNGQDTTDDDDDSNGNNNGDYDEPSANDNKLAHIELPSRAPDEVIQGNLSSGSTIGMRWAEQNYCWPATENPNFNGAHVFYQESQPRGTDLYIRVAPANGVDVSVYAIQSTGDFQTPPEVSSVWECDAMYDQQRDSNPGIAEVLYMANFNPFSVTIGVAGANTTTSGAYELQIWREPGVNYDTAR